ncbi:MAG: class I SAM-dependent methyltransferase [Candidatus Solibacter sp.]|jgi:SAM-dependent methyltransferase
MEWFEDESLWRELYPYVFPLERVAAAEGQVSGILALTGVTGGAVLDLCCGPGRHAVEFARRGFAVTGVDRSGFLLERARERADAAAVAVEWVLDDMREFARPATFDLACNLFTSFGYFQREEDNLRVLRNVRESLRDGGTLVMDMVGRERMERQGMEPRHTHFADGAVLIQQPHVNQDWTRLDNDWTLVKAGQSRGYRFEHYLYSGPGLEERLLSCGFAGVRLYGDLDGSPYGPEALRLVAVARKT